MSIALLWDASHLWGLCAHHALADMGIPHSLLRSANIAQTLDTDKVSLLIVPGGSARNKFEALGTSGREAVRRFVAAGGSYLGFCGGAGLALADAEIGLGLCPWKRAKMSNRLQHQLSGNVRVVFGHDAGAESDLLPQTVVESEMPVWWPGRFDEPDDECDVDILARYSGFGADLHVADLRIDTLPQTLLADWEKAYHIGLAPDFIGMPCVIAGRYGSGRYLLSYAHLETPASPAANAWFARLLHVLGGAEAGRGSVSAWYPAVGALWTDKDLLACRELMADLLVLGNGQGLLFPRLPWLVGWHAGVPGVGLNTMSLALNVLAGTRPAEAAVCAWESVRTVFRRQFEVFIRQAAAYLMAQHLASTVPEAVRTDELMCRRSALFGSPMLGGGECQRLLDILDGPLFAALENA